jgi:transposase InsO family protein
MSFVIFGDVCQATKPDHLAPKGLLAQNPRADRPWKIISTDLIGPFSRSKQEHTFVLVVHDFCRFFPLRQATSRAVARLLEDEIFLLFGVPQILLADNGKQYTGTPFTDLAKRYGVTIRYNAVYHPQGNPTERVNQTLKSMLKAFIVNPAIDSTFSNIVKKRNFPRH